MQVNHTMTQLMTERETLRAEVERQDREIEQARMTAEYWKAEHNAANAEIERLRAALRSWRDDYSLSLDGLTIPVPVYQIENLIGKN